MATEIELKAHVKDSEELRSVLLDKAAYLCAFEKEDCYWIPAGVSGGEALPGIRVRREKCVFPGGTGKESVLVTYKTKERRDGIEVNDESEFEVEPVQDFERFLSRMGYRPGTAKRKMGWAYTHDGITAELAEVQGLGWFIELEILVSGDTAGRAKSAEDEKKLLLDFLDSLGVERGAIESRYYTEMLREQQAAGPSA